MITFGLGMQDKDDAIPKEVYEWLKERNEKYPDVQFEIDTDSVEEEQKKELEEVLKYSRVFMKEASRHWGISRVLFPYKTELWKVKIMGRSDKNGKILNFESEDYENGSQFSQELRSEIAGVPEQGEYEFCLEHGLGVPRKENEPVLDKPTEMIPIKPEGRTTSEVSMRGRELDYLMKDKGTKKEITKGIYEKDWEKIRRIQMGGRN